MSENQLYGWFDESNQSKPTHDPPYDAPCLLCGDKISADDVRTHSLMYVHPGKDLERCYFYRTHATCDDRFPSKADGFVLDMISRNEAS